MPSTIRPQVAAEIARHIAAWDAGATCSHECTDMRDWSPAEDAALTAAENAWLLTH